jgi:hypothetical protein
VAECIFTAVRVTLLLSLFLLCCQLSAQKDRQRRYVFSGTIFQTREYCGGPPPSDELELKLRTPAPYPGKILFVKSGLRNNGKAKKLAVICADSLGQFNVRLPAGRYCILQESQLRALNLKRYKGHSVIRVTNEDCLKKWWHTCFVTFEIPNRDVRDFRIDFHVRCHLAEQNPCLEYTGPLAP